MVKLNYIIAFRFVFVEFLFLCCLLFANSICLNLNNKQIVNTIKFHGFIGFCVCACVCSNAHIKKKLKNE